MAKKTKKPEYAPKKYDVQISKYGPNFAITVEQYDPSMPRHSNRISLSVRGLTTMNRYNDVALFNVVHNAIAHAMGARYPDEVGQVLEYADRFYSTLDLDAMHGVAQGDSISLEVVDWDFEAEFPSSEKTRRHATGEKQVYRYEFFGEKDERESRYFKDNKGEKPTRLTFLD